MTDSTDGHRMNRRSFLTLAGTAGASVALAGCSGSNIEGDGNGSGDGGNNGTDSTPTQTGTGNESDGEGQSTPSEFEITITQGQMPTTLDPHNHRETPTDNVVVQVYEGLLGRDPEGKIQAELATEWERVEEGLVRFTIRDGVTFHNGNDLTPEDIAFSINRIVDPEVSIESPQADQLAGVTGASVVDGERAVEVESDGINPIVFSEFATYCDIMNEQWVTSNDKSFVQQNMMGTGPFKLQNYEQDVRVVLERNEEYWRDPAAASQVVFDAAKESSTRVNKLVAGESDLVVNVPPQEVGRVKGSDTAAVTAVPSTRVIYNAMVYNREPFDSAEFRQAMNYAINLDSIIENILSGFADATGQPTLEGFVGYNGQVDPYPHDPGQAETLIEESGNAGASIELHTPVGRYLKDVEIAQAVANQIDSLSNVSCTVKQRDFGALAGELTDGDISTGPKFYLIGWGNATFDASQTIIPLLTTDGALTSYSNEEVDSLIEQAQSESDSQKRESLLQQSNKLLHDQAPWIFLNRQYSVYGASSRIQWTARRDERINAYAITPAN